MLSCILWIVVAVIVAGVLVWAMKALPLDPTIQQIGKVAIVVIFVIALVIVVMNCLGVHMGNGPVIR